MTYALDTNIISALLRNDDHVFNRYYGTIAQGHRCIIPLIVYYEVKRGLTAKNASNKMRLFEMLICL